LACFDYQTVDLHGVFLCEFLELLRGFEPRRFESQIVDCEHSGEHSSAKGVARTNIPKQVATFWQGELASLRVCVSGASSPKEVGILLRIVAVNASGAKKRHLSRWNMEFHAYMQTSVCWTLFVSSNWSLRH
jgi:hypothetical protein